MTEDAELPETPETPETPEVDPFHDRAVRMGWRPLEEYHGPKDRWVDAKTFVERGETELPIIRERFRKLDDRLASTERELINARTTINDATTKIKEQSDVMQELRELSRNAEKRGFLSAQRDLADKERKAVEEANTNEYDRIQIAKRQLEETRPVDAPPARRVETKEPVPTNGATAPQLSPADTAVVTNWITENSWFNSDPELSAVATSIHGVFKQQSPNESLADNLARVRERVTTLYPEKFNNQRRAAPSAVHTPTAPAPRPKGKTVNDLPPEAKTALAKIKREIPTYSDQEYMRQYFGPEELIAS